MILPVHNGEPWLGQAIQSVLDQTHHELELLLVDDGSTDGSAGIIQRFAQADSRIRVIQHENWGMAESLNDALMKAQYEWVARMDADDVMLPHRLERQTAFLAENPDVVVTSCLVEYINAGGRVIGRSTSALTTREEFRRCLQQNEILAFNHPGAMLRRDAALAVGGYRAAFNPAEDLDLWNRIAETQGLILVQPEYLLRYRIHERSMWSSASKTQTEKLNWLQDCIVRRRSGLPEQTFEQYLASEREIGWLYRLNRARKSRAVILYRNARSSFASGHQVRSIAQLGASALLRPSYALGNVWSKFVQFRIRSGRH